MGQIEALAGVLVDFGLRNELHVSQLLVFLHEVEVGLLERRIREELPLHRMQPSKCRTERVAQCRLGVVKREPNHESALVVAFHSGVEDVSSALLVGGEHLGHRNFFSFPKLAQRLVNVHIQLHREGHQICLQHWFTTTLAGDEPAERRLLGDRQAVLVRNLACLENRQEQLHAKDDVHWSRFVESRIG